MDAPADIKPGEFLRQRLEGESHQPGTSVVCGQIALMIRGLNEAGTIECVEMVILPALETLTTGKEQDAAK